MKPCQRKTMSCSSSAYIWVADLLLNTHWPNHRGSEHPEHSSSQDRCSSFTCHMLQVTCLPRPFHKHGQQERNTWKLFSMELPKKVIKLPEKSWGNGCRGITRKQQKTSILEWRCATQGLPEETPGGLITI